MYVERKSESLAPAVISGLGSTISRTNSFKKPPKSPSGIREPTIIIPQEDENISDESSNLYHIKRKLTKQLDSSTVQIEHLQSIIARLELRLDSQSQSLADQIREISILKKNWALETSEKDSTIEQLESRLSKIQKTTTVINADKVAREQKHIEDLNVANHAHELAISEVSAHSKKLEHDLFEARRVNDEFEQLKTSAISDVPKRTASVIVESNGMISMMNEMRVKLDELMEENARLKEDSEFEKNGDVEEVKVSIPTSSNGMIPMIPPRTSSTITLAPHLKDIGLSSSLERKEIMELITRLELRRENEVLVAFVCKGFRVINDL